MFNFAFTIALIALFVIAVIVYLKSLSQRGTHASNVFEHPVHRDAKYIREYRNIMNGSKDSKFNLLDEWSVKVLNQRD